MSNKYLVEMNKYSITGYLFNSQKNSIKQSLCVAGPSYLQPSWFCFAILPMLQLSEHGPQFSPSILMHLSRNLTLLLGRGIKKC